MRNAKIVCTLGPASDDRATIRRLAEAGMAVARLNASHGTRDHRADVVDRARAVERATDDPLAVMLDLQGPEVRTAATDAPVHLATDSTIHFTPGDETTAETVGLTVSIAGASPGDAVLLDDGRIQTVVEEVYADEDTVVARVVEGGDLPGRSGVNVPGVDLGLDPVTDDDRADIELAVEKDVDFVAASFVRDGDDVLAVGEAIEAHGTDIPIIAKIERAGAVQHLESIVEEAYGVMVARGDLGVELPMEEVPIIQKRVIRRCQAAGVPVITATEMLESMVHERRPTRAETSDVANAVLDGTDAVMLSGETAVGDDPVRVVEAMDRIVREAEESPEAAELREQRVPGAGEARTDALARSARYLARDVGATAVVVASESGYTALKTAKYRPGVPVVAATPSDHVRRRLALSWGVSPASATFAETRPDAVIETAVGAALDAGVAESGDTVVVLSGMMTDAGGAGTTNMLKVHVAAEAVATGRSVVDGRTSGPLARSADGDLGELPDGAVLALEAGFDGEFAGDTGKLAGIVAAEGGLTGYPALVARELGIPMISSAPVPESVTDGTTVTLDAERGVLYEGDVRDTEVERG